MTEVLRHAQACVLVRGRRVGDTELAALDARLGAARGQHDQAASA